MHVLPHLLILVGKCQEVALGRCGAARLALTIYVREKGGAWGKRCTPDDLTLPTLIARPEPHT